MGQMRKSRDTCGPIGVKEYLMHACDVKRDTVTGPLSSDLRLLQGKGYALHHCTVSDRR